MSYDIRDPETLPEETVLEGLRTARTGLSEEEAVKRLETVGPNELPAAEMEGLLKRFFKHFHDVLIYILIGAAIITALLGHWIDTGVILAVVVINAIIGFVQEGKAEEALEGIRKMLSLHAQARRSGEWQEVEAATLVPGDYVRLRSGDRVPADIRLLEATNLRIEESALTGESVAAEKSAEAVGQGTPVGDRVGMAFSGSLVAAGRGAGVVVATGSKTEIGKINTMIAEVEKLDTPLTIQMRRFGKVLSGIIILMAVGMFGFGYVFHEYTLDELFFASIGFAVAAIPEGLPAILTITLAIGVQSMARRNAITRKLPAVETLGSVTVICSDKTGTLTRNEMTVRVVRTRSDRFSVAGTGYAPEGEIQDPSGSPLDLTEQGDVQRLLEIFAVCNDADVREDGGQWILNGEPTEGALRTLALKAGTEADAYERIAVVPFESESKFMATLNDLPGGGRGVFMKGAPDRLLDRCGKQLRPDGETEDLDRAFWEEAIRELAQSGQRVLAGAYKPAPEGLTDLSPDDLDGDLIFVGLAGIIDPPRPEAIQAIKICKEAGIRVKMITGDHAETAKAIGLEMGIGDGEHAVTGDELEAADDARLEELAQANDIFARTSPEHKLRLVRALQARREVVAMTGDGVNDAPALKRADVGVAMGIKGTEATKEAAEIVLADDNFASIELAVEEGRKIYDNLRKSILFILPTNGAEAIVILVAIIAGFALPLTPVQILWVNMVTAVTLALALAFEPSEPGLMKRPPRDPRSPIIGGYFIWRMGFISVLIGAATVTVFLIEKRLGMPLELARTVAVNVLVAGQVFYLFNSRYLREASFPRGRLWRNRVALGAVGVLAILQLIFVYAPFMNTAFGSRPLEGRHWLIPLGIGLGVFIIAEIEKAFYRHFHPLNPTRNQAKT
ncbi:MAG: cation-transporting P-type ATPase [Opitutales bacterium]|nr:cation-transporting P-type ATPase [Opitutales bacterium]